MFQSAQTLQGLLTQRDRVRDLHPDALTGADHGLEFVGGAGGDLPAAVHDDDPVAQLLHLLHVVARVDDGGAALVETLDALEDGAPALRVDSDRGLIEEDEVGAVGDAAGDVEASQQAAGELLGLELHELLQADEGDRLGHQAAPLGAVTHVEGAEGIDVLRHRELIEDGDILRHHADATLETVGGGRHRLTEDADRALVVGEQLKDAADRRRLARAVGAEQPQHLAARNSQGQAVHRDEFPIAFDQGLHLHGVIRSSSPSISAPSFVPPVFPGSWHPWSRGAVALRSACCHDCGRPP